MMNSMGFMRLKVLGVRNNDWLAGGTYSLGKGTASQTMPACTVASMCPNAESQNLFSTEKSVLLKTKRRSMLPKVCVRQKMGAFLESLKMSFSPICLL